MRRDGAGHACIEVLDDGPGIAAAERTAVLDSMRALLLTQGGRSREALDVQPEAPPSDPAMRAVHARAHARGHLRTGDAEAQSAGLTRDAATVDARDDVETTLDVDQLQRGVDELLVHLVREVVVKRTTVDLPLAGAGDDADAGDGLLATAGAVAGGDDGRTNVGASGGGRVRVGAVGDLAILLVNERGDLFGDGLFGDVLSHLVLTHWAIWVIS